LRRGLTCASLIVVATLGKFGGTLLAARTVGYDWRHSTALGILMNTRGLMELNRAERRTRSRHHLAGALHDDGHHGAGDDDGDDTSAAGGVSGNRREPESVSPA
jgi:hypothetical protein